MTMMIVILCSSNRQNDLSKARAGIVHKEYSIANKRTPTMNVYIYTDTSYQTHNSFKYLGSVVGGTVI